MSKMEKKDQESSKTIAQLEEKLKSANSRRIELTNERAKAQEFELKCAAAAAREQKLEERLQGALQKSTQLNNEKTEIYRKMAHGIKSLEKSTSQVSRLENELAFLRSRLAIAEQRERSGQADLEKAKADKLELQRQVEVLSADPAKSRKGDDTMKQLKSSLERITTDNSELKKHIAYLNANLDAAEKEIVSKKSEARRKHQLEAEKRQQEAERHQLQMYNQQMQLERQKEEIESLRAENINQEIEIHAHAIAHAQAWTRAVEAGANFRKSKARADHAEAAVEAARLQIAQLKANVEANKDKKVKVQFQKGTKDRSLVKSAQSAPDTVDDTADPPTSRDEDGLHRKTFNFGLDGTADDPDVDENTRGQGRLFQAPGVGLDGSADLLPGSSIDNRSSQDAASGNQIIHTKDLNQAHTVSELWEPPTFYRVMYDHLYEMAENGQHSTIGFPDPRSRSPTDDIWQRWYRQMFYRIKINEGHSVRPSDGKLTDGMPLPGTLMPCNFWSSSHTGVQGPTESDAETGDDWEQLPHDSEFISVKCQPNSCEFVIPGLKSEEEEEWGLLAGELAQENGGPTYSTTGQEAGGDAQQQFTCQNSPSLIHVKPLRKIRLEASSSDQSPTLNSAQSAIHSQSPHPDSYLSSLELSAGNTQVEMAPASKLRAEAPEFVPSPVDSNGGGTIPALDVAYEASSTAIGGAEAQAYQFALADHYQTDASYEEESAMTCPFQPATGYTEEPVANYPYYSATTYPCEPAPAFADEIVTAYPDRTSAIYAHEMATAYAIRAASAAEANVHVPTYSTMAAPGYTDKSATTYPSATHVAFAYDLGTAHANARAEKRAKHKKNKSKKAKEKAKRVAVKHNESSSTAENGKIDCSSAQSANKTRKTRNTPSKRNGKDRRDKKLFQQNGKFSPAHEVSHLKDAITSGVDVADAATEGFGSPISAQSVHNSDTSNPDLTTTHDAGATVEALAVGDSDKIEVPSATVEEDEADSVFAPYDIASQGALHSNDAPVTETTTEGAVEVEFAQSKAGQDLTLSNDLEQDLDAGRSISDIAEDAQAMESDDGTESDFVPTGYTATDEIIETPTHVPAIVEQPSQTSYPKFEDITTQEELLYKIIHDFTCGLARATPSQSGIIVVRHDNYVQRDRDVSTLLDLACGLKEQLEQARYEFATALVLDSDSLEERHKKALRSIAAQENEIQALWKTQKDYMAEVSGFRKPLKMIQASGGNAGHDANKQAAERRKPCPIIIPGSSNNVSSTSCITAQDNATSVSSISGSSQVPINASPTIDGGSSSNDVQFSASSLGIATNRFSAFSPCPSSSLWTSPTWSFPKPTNHQKESETPWITDLDHAKEKIAMLMAENTDLKSKLEEKESQSYNALNQYVEMKAQLNILTGKMDSLENSYKDLFENHTLHLKHHGDRNRMIRPVLEMVRRHRDNLRDVVEAFGIMTEEIVDARSGRRADLLTITRNGMGSVIIDGKDRGLRPLDDEAREALKKVDTTPFRTMRLY